MDPKIVIRSETGADAAAITRVTVAAFETLKISNHTEQFIIEALRDAGALTVSPRAPIKNRKERLRAFLYSDFSFYRHCSELLP